MLRKLLLAATLALAAALPAHAQGPLGIWPEPPEELIREALATPYAAVLLKSFAASVRKEGDPACLQAKALDDAASVTRGRTLLQRYGVQMMKVLNENFDSGRVPGGTVRKRRAWMPWRRSNGSRATTM